MMMTIDHRTMAAWWAGCRSRTMSTLSPTTVLAQMTVACRSRRRTPARRRSSARHSVNDPAKIDRRIPPYNSSQFFNRSKLRIR
jgi:hypothetical protein